MSQQVHYIIVDEACAEQRIDNYLLTYLKGVPKTRIYRLLRKGEVRVNKKRIAPSYRLQTGDSIRIPPVRMADKLPANIPNSRLLSTLLSAIIYEDDNLLIMNKPANLAVHGGTGIHAGVIEQLRLARPELRFLELAHRLDRATSGCLLIAKKRSVLRQVHELLRKGKVKKSYVALVKGQWRAKRVETTTSLSKFHLSSGERIVKPSEDGKTAKTVFFPKQVFHCATLVDVALYTGRTHQIRVHAMDKNHPIAGDDKYGDKAFNKVMRTHGLKRLFLHAARLEFVLDGGKTIKIEAELPEDLQTVLHSLGLDHSKS